MEALPPAQRSLSHAGPGAFPLSRCRRRARLVDSAGFDPTPHSSIGGTRPLSAPSARHPIVVRFLHADLLELRPGEPG